MGLLDGKVVAVTGAGRGIGRCIAIDCAAAGAKVVVADYGVEMDGSAPTSDIAESVVAEIKAAGGEAIALGSDVVDHGRRRGGRRRRHRRRGATSTAWCASPASCASACSST